MDPLIFGTPDPVLFSLDPDPDPDSTCNNGINKFKHKMMGYNIEFYAYLPKI